MKLSFLNSIEKYKIKIYLINLLILFYLCRTAIPFFKYPFIILCISFFLYIIIYYNNLILNGIKEFVQNYSLIIVLILILYLAFIFSNKIYLTVFKDVINTIIIIIITVNLNILIIDKRELKFFITNFLNAVILFALLISIFGLLNLLCIYENTFDDFAKIDNNFALLPVVFGIISILYLLISINLLAYQKLYYNFLICIYSLNIFFAGSRRGLIVLTSIIFIMLISQFFNLNRKNYYLKKVGLGSMYSLFSLVIMAFLLYYFTMHTSCTFKNRTLEFIGTKNIQLAQKNISLNLFSYVTIFNNSSIFSKLKKAIWYPEIDPRDPDCGWGLGDFKKAFPLTGENSEIVPQGAIGSLIDSTSFNSSKIQRIIVLLNNLEAEKIQRYKTEIYCYVSDDFDGYSACITLGKNINQKLAVTNNPISFYDLNCKGIWQKLEIEFNGDKGEIPILFTVIKSREKRKKYINLKGYVIIAYPQFHKVGFNGNLTFVDSYNEDRLMYMEKTGKLISSSKREDKFPKLNDNDSDILESKLFISTPPNLYKDASFAGDPLLYFSNLNGTLIDKDPIRNWAAKFISEDTTYYRYRSNLFVDTISNRFTESRITRWQFAWQIFNEEYSWKQKILGGGFSFLNWYGDYFHHDKTLSDWPHNPFLSVLLYSGIFGLLLYIVLMYKVFYYYIKYIREYYILFIFFLITFFFSFFSAGNPFDPPMMGFFVILPFFIHSIHKRDKPGLKKMEPRIKD